MDERKELLRLVKEAIKTKTSKEKAGLLFSGGVDSSTIGLLLKQLGAQFTAFISVMDHPLLQKAGDLENAERVAEELGIELKVEKVSLKEVKQSIPKIVKIINSTDVVMVGVALPLYFACRKAKEKGCKKVFSGLGSDELFAGYNIFRKSENLEQDIKAMLEKVKAMDFERDKAIAGHFGMEYVAPLMDSRVVEFALNLPGEMKLGEKGNKLVWREMAEQAGLAKEFAWRKKKAAQYGSNFDKGIEKLAKAEEKNKTRYLEQFLEEKVPVCVLFSSGKDSCYAMHLMKERGYGISCLVSIKSKNPDSFMFHTPAIELTELQAKAMGIPLRLQETLGEKEKELLDLEKALEKARKEFGIKGVVTGALHSNYQRERVDRVCHKLGLRMFNPLWNKEQGKEMLEVIEKGIEFVVVSVACQGLGKEWLGKKIGEKEVLELQKLNQSLGVNVAGEGGEFETLVLDAPMFKKRIKIVEAKKEMQNEFTGRLKINKAVLERK